MKKIIFFSILIINSLSAQKLTIDDAIKIGLENRTELKTQALQIKLTASENEKLKAKWQPQLSAGADVRINTQLQTSILPFDITGKNPGSSSQIQFGLPYNNTLGLQAEQKIFDANKKIDLQLNNTLSEVQINALEQQKTSIRQAITEAYYLVVYNKERLDFNKRTILRAEENLSNAAVKLKNGTLLQNDYDRYSLEVKNATVAYKRNQLDFESSLEALKYKMNLKSETPIETADDLNAVLRINETLSQPNFDNKSEIKAEEIALKLNELNKDKQKFRNYPTIAAYGNYTLLQQIDKPNPFKSGSIFPFNYVGIRINMPLFDGKQGKIIAGDYGIKQEINRINIDRIKSDFQYQTITALKQIDQAKLALADTRQNVELAQQILKTDVFRFEKGVLSFAELKNSEASLQNAETNYLSSVYSFLVASISYKKAVGFFER
jgi:outer membrane protein